MSNITLYHCPRTRGFHALWMLEEIGNSFEVKLVNIRDEIEGEAYAGVNPMRKVPALDVDGHLVTESTAICAWLADACPGAALAPAINDIARADYLRWLFFCAACIEPAFIDKAFNRETPAATVGWGSVDRVLETLTQGLAGKQYLVNDRFSAADLMIGSTLNFLMNFKMLERREPFVSYVDRLTAREAFKRATAKDAAWALELYGE
ncbi:glutathione S-transferase family protein [uncultured Maricaulis sp.]|uniref:glutathione S-transferase family protein n=1 Tax=uncultured Maricaulis sp. TaxID=174710 RepID=UPI0030DC4631|tara:strand:- start:5538 stop:6158 length:621 start_codon:yes stop_codon:yes gene_type:complete